MREYSDQKSDFCNKEKAERGLEIIFSQAQCSTLVLSYNSEGLLKKENILEKASAFGSVDFYDIPYPHFRNNIHTEKSNISEYLFI